MYVENGRDENQDFEKKDNVMRSFQLKLKNWDYKMKIMTKTVNVSTLKVQILRRLFEISPMKGLSSDT